jgi:membrane-bound lytic murein transglycosylase D
MAVFGQSRDQLYKSRLEQIPSGVPLGYNGQVREHINDYVRNDKKYTAKALSRFAFYDSTITKILAEYDLPEGLKFMAISLSGCSHFETSEEGGTGMFLMRYGIAKNKGLHISSYVDERRDPVLAAHAFAKEMKGLYARYNDWHKAIAAYYCTSLEMDRAISYSKDSLKQYWTAHTYLPFRYQKTVNKYIAAVYIYNFHREHNIMPDPYLLVPTDTVRILQMTSFAHLSKRLEVKNELLKELNPTYKKELIPNSGRAYYVRLPEEKVSLFESLGDSVYLTEEELKDTLKVEEPKPVEQPAYTAVYYKVKSGDMLMLIADYYDTYVSHIKRWNGLRSDKIRVGQRLKIMVPTSKLAYYKKVNTMSKSQKRRLANQD